MNFYELYNKKMPWGDYGTILFAGFSERDSETGQFLIERTAPSIPRIWKDCDRLFATDEMKKMLEQSGLKGLSFQPAIKKRIVQIDWMSWDFSSEPKFYPAQGEPENYIWGRKHNQKLADEIGELWAVIPSNQGLVLKFKPGKPPVLIAQSLGDVDFLVPENGWGSGVYVSENTKDWLSQNGIDDVYTKPKPVPVREATAEDFEAIRAEKEQDRLRREKYAKMTDADWRKYHSLTNEVRKLVKERNEAKSEAAKARRTAKAIANLQEAKDMYLLDSDMEALLAKLINEQQG